MKLGMGVLLVLVLTGAAASAVGETQWLAMDTRMNRGSARAFCESIGEDRCSAGESHVREFANGNTFVQIDSNLANRRVRIIIPSRFGADTLMEVLLMAHTSHSWGAQRIEIATDQMPVAVDGEVDLLAGGELSELFALAGADTLHLGKKVVDLSRLRSNRPFLHSKRELKGSIVVSMNHPELGQSVADRLGIHHLDVANITDEDWPRDQKVIFISSIEMPTNLNLFKTLEVAKRLKALDNHVIEVIPYFPYVRSDKIDQQGVTVGGKLVADLIENTGVDMIGFVKLHAPQVQGFFRIPTLHIETMDPIVEELRRINPDAIVSPDAGFQKEAGLYACRVGREVFVLNKQRDPKTGKHTLARMCDFDVKGLHLVLIDDETGTGGTIGDGATFLKSLGAASVTGIVSHLAGDGSKAIGSPAVDGLYATDSFRIDWTKLGSRVKRISIVMAIVDRLRPFVSEDCATMLLRQPNPNAG